MKPPSRAPRRSETWRRSYNRPHHWRSVRWKRGEPTFNGHRRPRPSRFRSGIGVDGRGARRASFPVWILPLARVFTWIQVYGLEHLQTIDGPAIFAANHQSHLDTPAI